MEIKRNFIETKPNKRTAFAIALAATISAHSEGTHADNEASNLRVERIVTNLKNPTSFAFGKNNEVFILEKAGAITLVKDYKKKPQIREKILNFKDKVHDYADLGATAIVRNNDGTRLYIAYVSDGPKNIDVYPNYRDECPQQQAHECAKSMAVDQIDIDPNTYKVLGTKTIWKDGEIFSHTHGMGSMAYLPDNNLLITTGDGARADIPDPNALRSQDLNSPHGKVIVLDPETGQTKTIAYGQRNPFGLSFDKDSNTVHIGNVGWGTTEAAYKFNYYINNAPVNAGWPIFEGNDVQPKYCRKFPSQCETVKNDPNIIKPIYSYTHGANTAAITGALTINPNENSKLIPGYYTVDYALEGGSMTYIPLSPDGNLDINNKSSTQTPFPVNLKKGPDGYLWHTSINFENPQKSSLHRISYKPVANPPSADMRPDKTLGTTPLTIHFYGPKNQDNVKCLWDFNSDGNIDNRECNTTYTYSTPGKERITLITKRDGLIDIKEKYVFPGDTAAPSAQIIEPLNETTLTPGTNVHYKIVATDPDDQPVTTKNELLLIHCPPTNETNCHKHKLTDLKNNEGDFIAPKHDKGTYIKLKTTPTDSIGLNGNPHIIKLKIIDN